MDAAGQPHPKLKLPVRYIQTVVPSQREAPPGYIPKRTADIYTGAVEGETMLFVPLCVCVSVPVWSEIKRLQGAPAASARYYIILSEDEYEKVSGGLWSRSKVRR